MRKALSITVLFVAVSGHLFGQGITHATTAEQCKADIAIWKTASKQDVIALPIKLLLLRSNELGECTDVLSAAGDEDNRMLADSIRYAYSTHALDRCTKFIQRHGLAQKLYDEDFQGAR